MKGLFSILLLFLANSTSFSLNVPLRIEDACKKFNHTELIDTLNSLVALSTEEVKYEWLTSLEREIVNGFFEQVFEITKLVRDSENHAIHTVYTYTVELIYRSGTIRYYRISPKDNSKGEGKNGLEALFSSYLQVYSIRLHLHDLFETEIVFGNHCGSYASKPVYREEMETLIEKEDLSGLINWLKSPKTELQLYAIEGLLKLQKNGVTISTEILDLIEIVSNKEGNVYTCSGCIHWNRPISETVSNIKKGVFD